MSRRKEEREEELFFLFFCFSLNLLDDVARKNRKKISAPRLRLLFSQTRSRPSPPPWPRWWRPSTGRNSKSSRRRRAETAMLSTGAPAPASLPGSPRRQALRVLRPLLNRQQHQSIFLSPPLLLPHRRPLLLPSTTSPPRARACFPFWEGRSRSTTSACTWTRAR